MNFAQRDDLVCVSRRARLLNGVAGGGGRNFRRGFRIVRALVASIGGFAGGKPGQPLQRGQSRLQTVAECGAGRKTAFEKTRSRPDQGKPGDAERQFQREKEQKQPDKEGTHRIEHGGRLLVQAHPEHPAAAHVADAEIPGRAHGNKADRQKDEAAPAPPRHGEPC